MTLQPGPSAGCVIQNLCHSGSFKDIWLCVTSINNHYLLLLLVIIIIIGSIFGLMKHIQILLSYWISSPYSWALVHSCEKWRKQITVTHRNLARLAAVRALSGQQFVLLVTTQGNKNDGLSCFMVEQHRSSEEGMWNAQMSMINNIQTQCSNLAV